MNAIILAAGMGMRLKPLTNDRPKSLVDVKGIPMVEQQIRFLHEAGIRDITLVSGYKAECLDYLRDKFGVEIIFNPIYDKVNNIHSMKLVLDRFGDTFVVEGDAYMHTNPFKCHPEKSTYFSGWRDNYTAEWGLKIDADSNLTDIVIGDGSGYVMASLSYWTKADAETIKTEINRILAEDPMADLFWDNAVLNIYHNLDIKLQPTTTIFEIDTPQDRARVEQIISTL